MYQIKAFLQLYDQDIFDKKSIWMYKNLELPMVPDKKTAIYIKDGRNYAEFTLNKERSIWLRDNEEIIYIELTPFNVNDPNEEDNYTHWENYHSSLGFIRCDPVPYPWHLDFS